MVAASYWSLLAPAIEMASDSKWYGANGEYAFVPVGIGFLVGAGFVYGTDALISSLGIQSPNVLLAMQSVGTNKQRQRLAAKLKSDKEDLRIVSSRPISIDSSTTIDGTIYSALFFLHILSLFSFTLCL